MTLFANAILTLKNGYLILIEANQSKSQKSNCLITYVNLHQTPQTYTKKYIEHELLPSSALRTSYKGEHVIILGARTLAGGNQVLNRVHVAVIRRCGTGT